MTDDDIKSLREALANPALHDPDASSTDTWEAVLTLFKACNKDRVARLLDEIVRLRANAARYAYLRDHMMHGVAHPHGSAIGMSDVLFGDDPDEAIDAAMKEQKE